MLPALLDKLAVADIVLYGHSDGGSIALLYAATGGGARAVVVEAPHLFVEDCTLRSIAAMRRRFRRAMPAGLVEQHEAPEVLLESWCGVWLSAAFRGWSIAEDLVGLVAPVLAIQGDADPLGTLAQLVALRRVVGGPYEEVILAGVGHAPHRERPGEVLSAVAALVRWSRRS